MGGKGRSCFEEEEGELPLLLSPALALPQLKPLQQKKSTTQSSQLRELHQFVTPQPSTTVSQCAFSTRHPIKEPLAHALGSDCSLLPAVHPLQAWAKQVLPRRQLPAPSLPPSLKLGSQPLTAQPQAVSLPPASSAELNAAVLPSGVTPRCVALPQGGRDPQQV